MYADSDAAARPGIPETWSGTSTRTDRTSAAWRTRRAEDLKTSTGTTPTTDRHLAGFGDLKDDGSHDLRLLIYCGVLPAKGQNLAARKQPDSPGVVSAQLQWGWAWPANRRLLYNRASADVQGRRGASARSGSGGTGPSGPAATVPDFALTKAPWAKGDPNAIGLDALSGHDPFI